MDVELSETSFTAGSADDSPPADAQQRLAMEAERSGVLCAGRRRVLVVAPSWAEATAVSSSSASVLRMVSCMPALQLNAKHSSYQL